MTMKVTNIKVVGFNPESPKVIDFNKRIEAKKADAAVNSVYDLNKDGKVDALDLSIVLLYIGYCSSDPGWDSMIKVRDLNGRGITPNMCDFNGDGVVDMLDMDLLVRNFSR